MPELRLTEEDLGAGHTVLERDGFVGTYNANRGTPFRQNGSFDQPSELLSSRVFREGVRISF